MDQSNADASGRTPGPEPQGAATPPEVAQGRGDEHGQGLPGEGVLVCGRRTAGERASRQSWSWGGTVERSVCGRSGGGTRGDAPWSWTRGPLASWTGRRPRWTRRPATRPGGARGRLRRCWPLVGISAGLLLAVWIVFGQTRRFQFVNWDDHVYLLREPARGRGADTGKGIWWAFSDSYAANWHPLTWLSTWSLPVLRA